MGEMHRMTLLLDKKTWDDINNRRNKIPTCIECGEPMINDIDSVTKKISKYLWKTKCGHAKNLRLSIG